MRHSVPGSARTLLLAALALAAIVIVGSVALMSTQSGVSVRTTGDHEGDDESADPEDVTPTSGGMRARPKHDKIAGSTETGEEGDGEWHTGGREPWDGKGNVVVDEKSIRFELDARHWEEVRREIDVFEADGKPIPPEIVRDLLAMLGKDDLSLDAVLALSGAKKDDATGRAIAEFALSAENSVEARKAALDALSRSGQKAALALVQQLVAEQLAHATADGDVDIVRHALLALAGIGGDDAAKTLFDLYKAHPSRSDGLGDAIVIAMGKLKGGDPGLAQQLRGARESGDREGLQNMYVAALIQGPATGPEVKAELQRAVEGASSFDAFADEDTRLALQGGAMPAAVAAGIVEPVLRQATTNGPMRDVALMALRQARGPDAAKLIVAALKLATDETQRRELTVALGETASFEATATLVSLLDDKSVNVRNAAARGIGQIRDPAAEPAVLAHLGKAAGDYDFTTLLVGALGTIGMNQALPTLEKLAASEEEFWKLVRPFVQNAIARIKTGNADSGELDPQSAIPAPAVPAPAKPK